ncbi:glycosyltransferase family 2 protein [Aeromonas hydrophila]|uniref:glycosyltransferase family 2 protein n=1 Tax=Aeromonas hydrophila TaxID=644 RepID=UPI003D22EAB2
MISVVIPTFKRPDLLARLLDSIAYQTLKPQEVIVVDDHSNMNEEYHLIIEKYREEFEILKYIVLEKNSGAPTARNTGIHEASSEWIALVDDDDEWLPTKLEKQYNLIEKKHDKNLGLIYTWTEAVGKNGQESYTSYHSHRGDVCAKILSTNFIMSASVIVKKSAIVDAGLFDVHLPSCQDWDMWTRIALKGYEFDVVEERLTIYHRHGGESIGLSARAKLGYKLFLESHWIAIFRKTSPLNWLKKIYLYISVSGAILRDK